jgi:spore coat polysaccharide biosynthesis protein SpsF
LPSQREHVTPYIYSQPQRFKIGSYINSRNLSHLRWTVDENSDYLFVSRVFERLYPIKPMFCTEDILSLLEKEPDLQKINSHLQRNEGYQKSLKKDEEWKKNERPE